MVVERYAKPDAQTFALSPQPKLEITILELLCG